MYRLYTHAQFMYAVARVFFFFYETRSKETRKKRQYRIHSFFNMSLLIVHCRLRDIVILTIHLFTRFIIIIILIINNNNRNCIFLLQIYRFLPLCVYVYVVHYLHFFYFIQRPGGGLYALRKICTIFINNATSRTKGH